MDRFLRLCGIYFLVCLVSNLITYLFFCRKIDADVEELVMMSATKEAVEEMVMAADDKAAEVLAAGKGEDDGFLKIQDTIAMINLDLYDSPPPNEEFERDLRQAKAALKILRGYY